MIKSKCVLTHLSIHDQLVGLKTNYFMEIPMEHTSTQSSSKTSSKKMSSSQMEQCAQVCLECYQVCSQTLPHCLEKGGEHASPTHIRLLTDCAAICVTSADFLIRNSTYHAQTCEACVVICEACADDCQKMGTDRDMQKCAEVCTRCAESCSQMSAN